MGNEYRGPQENVETDLVLLLEANRALEQAHIVWRNALYKFPTSDDIDRFKGAMAVIAAGLERGKFYARLEWKRAKARGDSRRKRT